MADEKDSVKSGKKTTEFWGKIVLQVIVLVEGLAGIIEPQLAMTIAAILEAAYALSRGVAKLFGHKLPPLDKK